MSGSVQLRIRTEYSMGQTYAPLPRVIDRLKQIGCTHAGIVDLNSTWGHVKFYDACKAAGIVPLLGVEVIVSDHDDAYPHMWFLARNADGLRELYQAMTQAYRSPIETKYRKMPRLYRSDVKALSKNVMRFAGEILDGDFLREIDAFIDLNPGSRVLNEGKRSIAREHNLPVVSTSDNSYAFQEDSAIYELLPGANRKPSPQHILETLEHQDAARGIIQSYELYDLPRAPMPFIKGDLEALCRAGIEARGIQWDAIYEQRLQYELKLIRDKGFESYFIIVADLVHYAKQHMLVGPSRGSAAGSLVCYLTRITEIDPLPPGLIFERFIDVSRSDMPDIDLDFPDDKREMVIEYASKKYGSMNVAKIGTVLRHKARSLVNMIGKSYDIEYVEIDALKEQVEIAGKGVALDACILGDVFSKTAVGKKFAAKNASAVMIANLEGHASHTGTHAAGVLIANEPISAYATVDYDGIAQIDKRDAERLGLLKIDILGLRTLTMLEYVNHEIEKTVQLGNVDHKIDWYNIDLQDEAAYEIFRQGKLCGIFQFEGQAMRSTAAQVPIEALDNRMDFIDGITAIARAGPMQGGVTNLYIDRANGKAFTALHPLVEKHMAHTFGLPIYQEQSIAIVREIGGFDWKEATGFRKAIAKSQGKEGLAAYRQRFIEGAHTRGLSDKETDRIWDLLAGMGSYQMNKAHTYSYATISYWCAYAKAHNPLQFAVAALKYAKSEASAIALLREIVESGFNYIPFDANKSELDWSARDGVLYGGFKCLHGIGDEKAKQYLELRSCGKLTQEHVDKLNSLPNAYADITPCRTHFAAYYDDPKSVGLSKAAIEIGTLPERPQHGYDAIIIGRVTYKVLKDANDPQELTKRDGKRRSGPSTFIDFKLQDDTGERRFRISYREYPRIGKEFNDSVKIGAFVMVRCTFIFGIPMGFVSKWKVLNV